MIDFFLSSEGESFSGSSWVDTWGTSSTLLKYSIVKRVSSSTAQQEVITYAADNDKKVSGNVTCTFNFLVGGATVTYSHVFVVLVGTCKLDTRVML